MNTAAIVRAKTKVRERVRKRAELGRDIAADLHRRAPRGGSSVNVYGQSRSAPGEQPAIEHGNLLRAIETSLQQVNSDTYRFVCNRKLLEFGTRKIAPRPLGRMTLAELKQRVKGG